MKRLPIELSPRARAELDEAACILNARRPQSGEAFVIATREGLTHVARFPFLYFEVKPGIRRIAIRKYPYILYYRPTPDRIEVLALLHAGHNPKALDHL